MIASVVLMLPTSALALCLSSLTQESRYAGFAWFAIWILGWFTYVAVSSAEASTSSTNFTDALELKDSIALRQVRGKTDRESVWTHLSLYHTLGRVQSWVFGFSKLKDVLASIAILVVIASVSLVVLFLSHLAPMRI